MKTFIALISISVVLAAPTVVNQRSTGAVSSSESHAGGHSDGYYQQSDTNAAAHSPTFIDHDFLAAASNSGVQAEQFHKNIYLGTTVDSGAATISLHRSPPTIHHGYSGANSNLAAMAVTLNTLPSKRDAIKASIHSSDTLNISENTKTIEASVSSDSPGISENTKTKEASVSSDSPDISENTKTRGNIVKASTSSHPSLDISQDFPQHTKRDVVKATANADAHASSAGFGHSNANANSYTHSNSNPGYTHTTKVNSGAMSVGNKSGMHNVDVYAKGSGQAHSTLFFNSNPSVENYYGSGSKAQAGASASSYGGVGYYGAQASAQAQAQSGNYGYYPQNVNSYSNSKASANTQVMQY